MKEWIVLLLAAGFLTSCGKEKDDGAAALKASAEAKFTLTGDFVCAKSSYVTNVSGKNEQPPVTSAFEDCRYFDDLALFKRTGAKRDAASTNNLANTAKPAEAKLKLRIELDPTVLGGDLAFCNPQFTLLAPTSNLDATTLSLVPGNATYLNTMTASGSLAAETFVTDISAVNLSLFAKEKGKNTLGVDVGNVDVGGELKNILIQLNMLGTANFADDGQVGADRQTQVLIVAEALYSGTLDALNTMLDDQTFLHNFSLEWPLLNLQRRKKLTIQNGV
jgi:hypothetical protein